MESGRWRDSGIAMNEGQQLGRFYLTGDHNLTTETHAVVSVSRPPRRTGSADKRDKISVSGSDRQAAYLYQTRPHC